MKITKSILCPHCNQFIPEGYLFDGQVYNCLNSDLDIYYYEYDSIAIYFNEASASFYFESKNVYINGIKEQDGLLKNIEINQQSIQSIVNYLYQAILDFTRNVHLL